MATQQPAQQADSPQVQKRKGIFPQKIRTVVITLGLVSLIICAAFWIWSIWGNLSTVMPVVFTVLSAIFGFLALPFLYSSHDSKNSLPIQVIVTQNQYNSQQPTIVSSDGKNTYVRPDDREGESKQLLSSPGIMFAQGKTTEFSRDELRKRLNKCLPAILQNIIFSLNPPSGVMSPSNTPQSQRVIELIQWAESDGPGLAKLYNVYLQEAGIKDLARPSEEFQPDGTINDDFKSEENERNRHSNPLYDYQAEVVQLREALEKTRQDHFGKGDPIYKDHCDPAIDTLKNLSELIQVLRENGDAHSYPFTVPLNDVANQVSNLKAALNTFRNLCPPPLQNVAVQDYNEKREAVNNKMKSLVTALDLLLSRLK